VLGDHARPRERALLALAEDLARRDAERDGLASDDVLERPALLTRSMTNRRPG
jgi:hypothetical protein